MFNIKLKGFYIAICLILFISFAFSGVLLIINNNVALTSYSSIGDIILESDTNYVNSATYDNLIDKLGTSSGVVRNLDSGTPIVFTMAGHDWEVVYRDPDKTDIITVWMTDSYANSNFGSGDNTVGAIYSDSVIRTTILDYYNTLNSTYSVLNNIIVPPYKMSTNYKTAQDKNDTYNSCTSEHGEISTLSDAIWLPSLYEIFYLWGLEDADRGSSASCWLRSGSTQRNPMPAMVYALYINASGVVNYSNAINNYGIRPAVHISLSALNNYSKFSIQVQTNDSTLGSVSGGGVFGTSGTDVATIIASSTANSAFSHWENSAGETVSTNESYSFNVTANETFTAIFRSVSITITTQNGGSEIESQTVDLFNSARNYSMKFTANNYLTQIKFSGDVEPRAIKYLSTCFGDIAECTMIECKVNNTGTELYLSILNFHIENDLIITLYFTNYAQNYQSAGSSIEGVAIQTRLSGGDGALVCFGEARICGYSTLDNLNYISVSAVAYSGYAFNHWEIDGEALDVNNYGLSAYLPVSLVENKVIVAFFSVNSLNINTTTEIGANSGFL